MKTEFLKIENEDEKEKLSRAGTVLREGGLCAIPTETVYGLAANALDGKAVYKIFEAKGRPQDNPLIVHIANLSQWDALVQDIPQSAKKLAEAHWPGPLTIILPKSEIIPQEVSCGLPTVAVRMPSHPIARAIIESAGVPLAAPSANTSGKPSPTTAEHVLHDMDGKIDMIVDGGMCDVGVESTVVTLCAEKPKLLRPGGITYEQLCAVLGEVEIADAVLGELAKDAKPESPGMKYKHYSPDADVLLIEGSTEDFCAYVRSHEDESVAVVCFDGEVSSTKGGLFEIGSRTDAAAHARRVFDVLRQTETDGYKTVLVHKPSGDGVDLAVLNRLLRAAAFRVITLGEENT